ncbi:heme peroxidase [Obba rivulosa]|uniref:Heme peroxidase n=1 Tax=Obba rivulosa TaxID=1052685 RepID=A0A8E2AUS4_9APHY|nr:heme peroxidase [Obba rivulosa]
MYSIRFAGADGVVNCSDTPQLEFLLGRPAGEQSSILAGFGGAGFAPAEAISLLSSLYLIIPHSHTVTAAEHVNPGTPFDSTPFIFDSQVFTEAQLRGTTFPGTGGNQGEVEPRLREELRLQSGHTLSRDSRKACHWRFLTTSRRFRPSFKAAMAKLAVLSQDVSQIIDCSEFILVPRPLQGPNDIEQTRAPTPFPVLPVDPGPATSAAPV